MAVLSRLTVHPREVLGAALLILAAGTTGCGSGTGPSEPAGPVQAGGDTTVRATDANAFSLPVGNIPMTQRARFSVGNAFFKQPWVTAPASTAARDGLGPLFNTNTCQSCHIKDGRGHAPDAGETDVISLLVRLSIAPGEADADVLGKFGAVPHPVYGGQIQDQSVAGVPAEARVSMRYTPVDVTLADGKTVRLRRPELVLDRFGYGDPGDALQTSVRIAPAMIGLGLLESIPAADLRAAADPDDADGDGISGRVNTVWDFDARTTRIGRFGWKAGQPSVRQQTAAAFAGDMGLTTTLFPESECQPAQADCRNAPDGGSPEVSDNILAEVVFYSRHLGVPARRDVDAPSVQHGESLFRSVGCAACHQPHQQTGDMPDAPLLSNQRFMPYTDLLLHDMGDALADHRAEFAASGREWRTAPLWGIGLAKTVSENAGFLHDGRARSLLEAILWHGGEAQAARDAVVSMPTAEREALIDFLESL
jgi:CxxC motif-containing protein (DUF1111 family)